jgi:hypothetical protein
MLEGKDKKKSKQIKISKTHQLLLSRPLRRSPLIQLELFRKKEKIKLEKKSFVSIQRTNTYLSFFKNNKKNKK